MRKAKSVPTAGQETKTPTPVEEEAEEVRWRRFCATLMGLHKICARRRCRRARLCLGPPTCMELHSDQVTERWPAARERIFREYFPGEEVRPLPPELPD